MFFCLLLSLSHEEEKATAGRFPLPTEAFSGMALRVLVTETWYHSFARHQQTALCLEDTDQNGKGLRIVSDEEQVGIGMLGLPRSRLERSMMKGG